MCSSMNADLRHNAGFFSHDLELHRRDVFRRCWQNTFSDTHYAEGGGETSKVQRLSGITIPDVAPNIKITLKLRVALL